MARESRWQYSAADNSRIPVAAFFNGWFEREAPTPDFAAARERMVHEQLMGAGRDVTDTRVIEAMRMVPRHEFVPAQERLHAYEDRALAIGFEQTISQPYIVALMSEKVEPRPTDRILEIGTGSGYQAAVLAQLVKEVFTVEIIEPLARRAAADLARTGCSNVVVRLGDGAQGWPEAAPFDAIMVACAPENVPPSLADQLKNGGRLIIPVGPIDHQKLVLLRKQGDRLEKTDVLPVRFVPMTGVAQHGSE